MSLTRTDGARSFGSALVELKRRGCNLLVTGALPERLAADVSAQMLGSPPELRARVFALLGRETDAARTRLEIAGRSLEPAIVVDTVEHPRAAVADGPIPTGEPGVQVRRIERTLPVVQAALRQAISEVKTAHYPLEPAELRLCVDSLGSLTGDHDVEAVRAFLETVGEDVVAADGMAHYVLPEDPADDIVAALEPCFDAIVEHRGADRRFEQRWRLPEYDIVTPWMRV